MSSTRGVEAGTFKQQSWLSEYERFRTSNNPMMSVSRDVAPFLWLLIGPATFLPPRICVHRSASAALEHPLEVQLLQSNSVEFLMMPMAEVTVAHCSSGSPRVEPPGCGGSSGGVAGR
ncbi:hypothetical protein NDU88_001575 [Pleurodeles waltl]|uniref:Uncharacterized protein n=1 Tax=Pleurodeles waltl TaxID=8319 RepID=A0AAV7UAL8_PLEWA|nr:hypothetical protein NDU88_001575 [Pleurodeles waltl]